MRPNPRCLLAPAAVVLVALFALPVGSADAGSTPAQKCGAAKLNAAGREIAGKMSCYAKAKRVGTGVDSTCLGNAQSNADTTINKADGGCPGTAAAIDTAVDNCVAAFLTDDPGNGACPSASAKAIGTSGRRELRCQARDVSTPASFAGCNAREDGRTTTVLSAVGGCVAAGAVLADTDACQSAIEDLVGPCGTFLTTWGSGGNGPGQFFNNTGVAVDASGNVFAADSGNYRIQKFDNGGTFLTTWGSGGSGPGQFNIPVGVAVDGSGNVFVADTLNERIQKFDNGGTFLTTWGGLGSGPGQFNFPVAVAVDGSGNVFVAEFDNNRIQKFDNGGTFLTMWGGLGSGPGQFFGPAGVAVDGSGNVFVADGNNERIQKFDNGGTFLTTWGNAGSGLAQFNFPVGVAVDGGGHVFVAEFHNNRIQKFACP